MKRHGELLLDNRAYDSLGECAKLSEKQLVDGVMLAVLWEQWQQYTGKQIDWSIYF
jgi:hypothetical protein